MLGWIDDDVLVVVARASGEGVTYVIERLGSSAPTPRQLLVRPDLAMDTAAYDGMHVIIGTTGAGGRNPELLDVDSGGAVRVIDLSSYGWAREWRDWGGVAPSSGGGVLLTGIHRDVLLLGGIRDAALPPDTIAQLQTDDMAVILVGRLAADSGPDSRMPARTGVYVFDREHGRLASEPVAPFTVSAVAPSSTGLAYLRSSDGSWHHLASVKELTQVTGPTAVPTALSLDGRYMTVEATGRQGPCVDERDCTVSLVNVETATVIASGPGPALSEVAFGPDSAAYAYRDVDGLQIAILDERGVHQLVP